MRLRARRPPASSRHPPPALSPSSRRRYGLKPAYIEAIVLPQPEKAASEPGAVSLRVSLMSCDAQALSHGHCLSLLLKLHQRLKRLQNVEVAEAAPAVKPPPPAKKRKAGASGAEAPAAAPPAAVKPPPPAKKRKAAEDAGASVDAPDAIAQLVAFGFSAEKAREALEEADGNVERAVATLCASLK